MQNPIESGPADAAAERTTIPLVEETVSVETRETVTGRVHVAKRVATETVAIDEPLLRQHVEVERVPVGRWVDGPLPERREGDRLVVPVVEEVLVVEKRYRLVEEIHLVRRQEETRHREEVTLRREEATVTRTGADGLMPPGEGDPAERLG